MEGPFPQGAALLIFARTLGAPAPPILPEIWPLFCFDSGAAPTLRPHNLRPATARSWKVCASAGNQVDCRMGAGPGPDESDAWVSRSESPYPKPAIAASPG